MLQLNDNPFVMAYLLPIALDFIRDRIGEQGSLSGPQIPIDPRLNDATRHNVSVVAQVAIPHRGAGLGGRVRRYKEQ